MLAYAQAEDSSEEPSGATRAKFLSTQDQVLELPKTSHAAAAAEANAAKVETDIEPPKGKTPNDNRISAIYQRLAPRVGPWIICIQTLPTTRVM